MSHPTPDDEREWEELSVAAKKSPPTREVSKSGPTPEDELEWLELSTGIRAAPPVPEATKEEDGADKAVTETLKAWRRRALVAEEVVRKVVEVARAVQKERTE